MSVYKRDTDSDENLILIRTSTGIYPKRTITDLNKLIDKR